MKIVILPSFRSYAELVSNVMYQKTSNIEVVTCEAEKFT